MAKHKKISFVRIKKSIDHAERELKKLRPKVIQADQKQIDLEILALKLCNQIVDKVNPCKPTKPFMLGRGFIFKR